MANLRVQTGVVGVLPAEVVLLLVSVSVLVPIFVFVFILVSVLVSVLVLVLVRVLVHNLTRVGRRFGVLRQKEGNKKK